MNSSKTAPKVEPARHWINGEWIGSSTVANSISNSTGEVLGQYSAGGRTEAAAAITAARNAFDNGTWAHDPQLRARALSELADRLDERAEAIALTLSREMGKTLRDSKLEATWSPFTLRYNAGTALSQVGTSAEIAPGVFATSMREPIGVAGIIVPWNSPLALLVRALGPALAAGCTTAIKLPGQTALVNSLIAEAAAATASLPKGVVNVFTEAVALFSDPQRAFEYAVEFRWPGGNVTCPRCGQAKHSFIKTRRLWFCYVCKKQFTVKVGTIMEDSPLGLDKWMVAIWMLANCKNGISSYELGRVLGIRQNSAWFMLHRIREAMKDDPSFKFGGEDGGPVESDETFVGPNPYKMHKTRKARVQAQNDGATHIGKTAVFGVLDRGLRQVRAKVVPNVKRETLQNAVLNEVQHGSKVYTDAAVGYDHLAKQFVHEVVNHAKEYVNGQVHTQGMDNFWSLLKRTLRGTYVAVEPFHLDHYLDEQVFRYNNRATKDNRLKDSDRFALVMSQVAGKRLTYAELTGKDTDSLHHLAAEAGPEEPF